MNIRRIAWAITKTAASLGFVWIAWRAGTLHAGIPGAWVGVGLVLSVVGDVCLLSHARRPFLVGLGAFLLAHVAFVASFLALGVRGTAAALAAVPFGTIAAVTWWWLAPHTGSMRTPVLAYVLVITVMVCCAVGAAAAAPGRGGMLLAAVLFFLSDLTVARDRFVAPGLANRLIGLPLYYAAQVLFAVTTAIAVAQG